MIAAMYLIAVRGSARAVALWAIVSWASRRAGFGSLTWGSSTWRATPEPRPTSKKALKNESVMWTLPGPTALIVHVEGLFNENATVFTLLIASQAIAPAMASGAMFQRPASR